MNNLMRIFPVALLLLMACNPSTKEEKNTSDPLASNRDTTITRQRISFIMLMEGGLKPSYPCK
jgi:hypothetical protein